MHRHVRNFLNFNKTCCSLTYVGFVYLSSLAAEGDYSANPKIGIVASGQLAGVWDSFDQKTQQYCIKACYGSIDDVTVISNPSLYCAREPKIAVSNSNKAIIKAVAVWIARDLATKNDLIQATILTTLGWSDKPTVLSKNDGSEKPNHDFEVSMLGDKQQIVVTWSAYMPYTKDTVVRCAISNNGGLIWDSPTSSN